MTKFLYVSARPEQLAATAEYASFRSALGDQFEVDRIDLTATPLLDDAADRYAGFVIGGSPFNVSDTTRSDLQRRVENDLERIAQQALTGTAAAFFTCYGIGVVTRMLGAAVDLQHPEPTSATRIFTTHAATEDPIFAPSAPSFLAFTAHKEASQLPPGATLLASNDACPVQAYRVGDRLYAAQFHPELTPSDFAHRMYFYRDGGYFNPDEFAAVERAVLAASVTEPRHILRRFAEAFADPFAQNV